MGFDQIIEMVQRSVLEGRFQPALYLRFKSTREPVTHLFLPDLAVMQNSDRIADLIGRGARLQYHYQLLAAYSAVTVSVAAVADGDHLSNKIPRERLVPIPIIAVNYQDCVGNTESRFFRVYPQGLWWLPNIPGFHEPILQPFWRGYQQQSRALSN